MKVLVGVLLVLLVVLQYRFWFGDGSIQELSRLRNEAVASRAEVLELSTRNKALAAEVADLKRGLEAIEERARADLGMISEGETFYQFIRETRDTQGSELETPNDAADESSGNASVSSDSPSE